jgi:hypothetical protein
MITEDSHAYSTQNFREKQIFLGRAGGVSHPGH